MKSQDIGLLLKLISLHRREIDCLSGVAGLDRPNDWQDWNQEEYQNAPDTIESSDIERFRASLYTTRSLELETGISKTQISESLRRCMAVGLSKIDRKSGVPRANTKGLLEFIVYGLKYVFPAKAGELTRGICTSFSAPVLEHKLMSAGAHKLVWPDALANSIGLSVQPLFRTATYAVRRDPEMYALLALVDAIRLGNPREANLAADLLKSHMDMSR